MKSYKIEVLCMMQTNKKARQRIVAGFKEKSLSLAGWTGLEPATSAVTGQHSNQLNYQPVPFSGRQR